MRPGGRPTSQNASFREPGMNLDPISTDLTQETISTFSQLLVSHNKVFGKFSNMKYYYMSCYAPATKYMDGMCIDMSETSRLPSVFTVKWSDGRCALKIFGACGGHTQGQQQKVGACGGL